ncbi:hypothetical protein KUTeg_003792 [Tegillarca granosa]|uniref:Uncharacterized protein n=1 Tax=Tegillarca granosa TaxID=220873 RepID=A0ABQ9FRC1_TEGGR|nr:hypothetical protein KUTeg_003792 [Tegillarca granosa]
MRLEMEFEDLLDRIKSSDDLCRKACEQIIALNRKLQSVSIRYQKATKDGRRSFRYSLRLRLATIEGVRNMYYEFAKTNRLNFVDRSKSYNLVTPKNDKL